MNESITVASLVPSVVYSVESRLLYGSITEALNLGMNHITVVTGRVEDPSRFTGDNLWVFELFNALGIDAYSIFGQGISAGQSIETLAGLFETLSEKPVVSIGCKIPNVESVTCETYTVQKQLVNHLIEEKGCATFVYVAGPALNEDAQIRQKAFSDAIADHGITVPTDMIWYGDFTAASVYPLISKHLQENKPLPDAFVCASDAMAVGVIDELSSRGIDVPKDILITGFDNTWTAAKHRVPVSSIEVPLGKMAKRAVQLVNARVLGQHFSVKRELTGIMHLRASTNDSGLNEDEQAVVSMPTELQFQEVDLYPSRLRVVSILRKGKPLCRLIEELSDDLANCGVRELYIVKRIGDTYVQCNYDGKTCQATESVDLDSLLPPNWQIGKDERRRSTWVLSILGDQKKSYGLVAIRVDMDKTDFVEFFSSVLTEAIYLKESDRIRKELEEEVLRNQHMMELGRMIAGLAHEINTPLGNALMATSNLAHDYKDLSNVLGSESTVSPVIEEMLNTQSDSLNILSNSLNRVKGLVALFKQLSAGYDTEPSELTEFDSLIKCILSSLERKLTENGIALKTDFEPGIKLETYPSVWARILTQLIINSIDHGFKPESTERQISLRIKRLNEKKVVFELSDNGVGISEEKISDIFSPFYTTLRNENHPGLGLNIVYNLVKHQLKGRITATPKQPSGLGITITFPG